MRLRRSARLGPLGLATCALVALAGLGCGAEGDAAPEDRAAREAAPDFTLRDLDGNEVSLAGLRGRTVVIDFWATWCAPCVFQPPELNAVWAAHRDSGKLMVLGIEVGGASVDEVRAWGVENEAVAEYPLLVGADDELARRFGVMGYPASAIVAPDGTIDSVTVGLASAEEIEAEIAPLIE